MLYQCYQVLSTNKKEVKLFCSEHEEAKDRLQYDINHAVKFDVIEAALVSFGDTNAHISLVYNFEYYWATV